MNRIKLARAIQKPARIYIRTYEQKLKLLVLTAQPFRRRVCPRALDLFSLRLIQFLSTCGGFVAGVKTERPSLFYGRSNVNKLERPSSNSPSIWRDRFPSSFLANFRYRYVWSTHQADRQELGGECSDRSAGAGFGAQYRVKVDLDSWKERRVKSF